MTAPPRGARRIAATAGLACIAAAVTACGPSAAPAATTTVTVTASPSVPSGPSTSPATASASPTAAGDVTACPTLSLRVKLGVAQGAAGSVYTALDFVNISDVTCTLYGYPGVALAAGSPITQIGLGADESHASPRRFVKLRPHRAAHALLRIVNAGNYSAAACQPATAHFLQVFPPNQTTAIYVNYTAQACSKPVPLLTVGVVQPGSGGAS
jgi:Protein of unknown function (DUF4232)